MKNLYEEVYLKHSYKTEVVKTKSGKLKLKKSKTRLYQVTWNKLAYFQSEDEMIARMGWYALQSIVRDEFRRTNYHSLVAEHYTEHSKLPVLATRSDGYQNWMGDVECGFKKTRRMKDIEETLRDIRQNILDLFEIALKEIVQ